MTNIATEPRHDIEEFERYSKSIEAAKVLRDEIADLKEEEINEQTSPFIAGLDLSRHIEAFYLAPFAMEYKIEEKTFMLGHYESRRSQTEDLQQISRDARSGDFKSLRQFIQNASDQQYKIAKDVLTRGQTDSAGRSRNLGDKLALIAGKMPDSGDGSAIQVPNPAHIEEAVPLKIQLERFAKGESIR